MTSIDVLIREDSFTPSLALPRKERGQNPLPGARPKAFRISGEGREGVWGNSVMYFEKLNSSRVYLDEQSNLRWLALSALYRYACRLKNYREVPVGFLEDSEQLAAWAQRTTIP